jgi:hypothetical protein
MNGRSYNSVSIVSIPFKILHSVLADDYCELFGAIIRINIRQKLIRVGEERDPEKPSTIHNQVKIILFDV